MAFQDLYSAAAKPFNWKYTTRDRNTSSTPTNTAHQ